MVVEMAVVSMGGFWRIYGFVCSMEVIYPPQKETNMTGFKHLP